MTATLEANAVAPIGFGTLLDVVDWEVGLAVLAIPAAASAAMLSPRVLWGAYRRGRIGCRWR